MEKLLNQLRGFLVAYYDIEELRDLCFTLGVDYDSLRGEGKRGKARELVLLLRRQGRLERLLQALRESRRELFEAAGLSTEAAFVEGLSPEPPGRQPEGVVEAPAPKGFTVRQPFEPEMVLIPEGDFLMGSDPRKDKDADDAEQPQHRLYLPGYYLAKTPVTNWQYAAFVKGKGHEQPEHWKEGRIPEGKEEHPVVWVSWRDAVAYCEWLAEVTGKGYRLPSEAQWEKGARGTQGWIYPWGDEWDPKRCNCREGGPRDTTLVGADAQGASPYGLLDMAGNVWEWTVSLYRNYLYQADDGREDLSLGGDRVLRGGAFYDGQRSVRCASRRRNLPNVLSYNGGGFRVVVAPGV